MTPKPKIYIYLKDGEYSFAKSTDRKLGIEIIDIDGLGRDEPYCYCPVAEGQTHTHRKVS